jgi:hypothetical protein
MAIVSPLETITPSACIGQGRGKPNTVLGGGPYSAAGLTVSAPLTHDKMGFLLRRAIKAERKKSASVECYSSDIKALASFW